MNVPLFLSLRWKKLKVTSRGCYWSNHHFVSSIPSYSLSLALSNILFDTCSKQNESLLCRSTDGCSSLLRSSKSVTCCRFSTSETTSDHLLRSFQARSTVSELLIPSYLGLWYQLYGDYISSAVIERGGYCVTAVVSTLQNHPSKPLTLRFFISSNIFIVR